MRNKQETLSDKRKRLSEISDNNLFLKVKDVKEFIRKFKEEDLYRSLVNKYGKAKVYSLSTIELLDLIEDYFNKKIDNLAGEELI